MKIIYVDINMVRKRSNVLMQHFMNDCVQKEALEHDELRNNLLSRDGWKFQATSENFLTHMVINIYHFTSMCSFK